MKWQKLITLILGVWFVVSAFLPYILSMPVDLWNNFFMGILIVLFGLFMIKFVNLSVIVIILSGLWIALISFVPFFITKEVNLIDSILIGILVIIMSVVQRRKVTR